MELTDLDFLIYVGKFSDDCSMRGVDGEAYELDCIDIWYSNDNDSVIRAQKNLKSLEYLGVEYADLFITYIPSRELEFKINNSVGKFPSEITQALIKCKANNSDSEKSKLKVILSGRRSALICIGSKLYRLKGCGNLFQGFVKGEVKDAGINHFEIFGAQFKNTCLREQYITSKIDQKLKSFDVLLGNKPVGFWKYDPNLPVEAGVFNDGPMIEKYCGIFETLSEKRLGEHFFGGLNVLLKYLLEDFDYAESIFTRLFPFSSVIKQMKCSNFQEVEKDRTPDINFNDLIFMNLLVSDPSTIRILHPKEKVEQDNMLFDTVEYLQKEMGDSLDILEKENKLISQLLRAKIQSEFTDITGHTEGILQTLESLFGFAKQKKINIFYLIQATLAKIGYEVGKIKKAWELIDLNWGTYDYHSNSHLDNFLVLPFNKDKRLLSPLDFDLAFFKDEFIDLKYNQDKSKSSGDVFDDLINSEKTNLLFQLSGFNTIVNIEVEVLNISLEANSKNYSNVESFRNLCFENIHHYLALGYNLVTNEKTKRLEDLYEGVSLIAKLALLLSIKK